MDKSPCDYLMKLIIIGDSGVGKTCFLMRFFDDKFTSSHITTIGIDFKFKIITLDGKNVKLQVWDTAGQERFRTITQTYYKGAMGIILVYDCSERNTFDNVKSWVKQIDQHANPGVAKVLVGNKCDVPNRKVKTEEGKKLADEYGMGFFETSAKNNINIKQTFYYLAKEIKDKSLPELVIQGTVKVNEKTAKKPKNGCC